MNNETSEIRLRTLTLKSKLGFGKYHSLTLEQIIKDDHHFYLRWIYYNNSQITFNEEILNVIGIIDDWKIDKPGKNNEKYKLFQEKYCKGFNGLEKIIKRAHDKKYRTKEFIKYSKYDNVRFSKASLVRYNHGHKNI